MAPVVSAQVRNRPVDALINAHCETKSTITIAEYIFLRVHQLGINSIFGVPGDFNLQFLEHIYDVPSLNWIGCCNELNAAYAADAYAKVSRTMGVLFTTYGVGELSALNGVAGAYTEFAPLLHIVGTSAMKLKRSPNVLNIHHLISNKNHYQKSDHYLYERIASEFSIDCGSIEDDPITACEIVDRVIINVWKNSRPGYIFLPCDLPDMQVDAQRLKTPLDLSYDLSFNYLKVSSIVDTIVQMIYSNKNVSIIVDDFIKKFRMEDIINKIVDKCDNKVNLFSTWFAKGIISEEGPRFVGTYIGKYKLDVSRAIESSDLILHFGNYDHELNTGAFSFNLDPSKLIKFNPQYIQIGSQELQTDVTMLDVLPLLLSKLDSDKINTADKITPVRKVYNEINSDRKYPLTEVDLIETLSSSLQKDDTLIVETCSFLFGVPDITFNGANFVSQAYWASIGYALPATLGASIAKRDFDLPGKVITVEGDGSAQMTLQELSSLMKHDINATMYILNNDGYTIERAIMGPHSPYNDLVANWQWTKILEAFGDTKGQKSTSFKITKAQELRALVSKDEFYTCSKFQLVELVLPKFDIPDILTRFIEFEK